MLDGPLAEFAALHQADTPEALQRVLLIPGRRTDTDCREAVAAFRRAFRHADEGDDTGLLGCVALACTHHRWQGVGRRLLEVLVEQGVMGGRQVGTLAPLFLDVDAVPVSAPGAWLVDYYVQERDGGLRRIDPAKCYTLWRPVAPQLRRWAAKEAVQGPDDVGPVEARALELDRQHGTAVALGLLDAADKLDVDAAASVVDLGLDWPEPSVRLAALKRLAGVGRDAEALERAEGDRAARVRRWAATYRQRTLLDDRGEPTAHALAASAVPEPDPHCSKASQSALFG